MAEAFFNALAGQQELEARAVSAGTAPGGQINPVAAEAMAEIGLPMDGHTPKQLTPAMVAEATRVITMGCGVHADQCPAGTYITEDWGLPDPHGQGIEGVREVRDAVRVRVEALLGELVRQEPATCP